MLYSTFNSTLFTHNLVRRFFKYNYALLGVCCDYGGDTSFFQWHCSLQKWPRIICDLCRQFVH